MHKPLLAMTFGLLLLSSTLLAANVTRAFGLTFDPSQWYMENTANDADIDIEDAWRVWTDCDGQEAAELFPAIDEGNEVVIAVLDSGFEIDDEQLKHVNWVAPWDAANGDNDVRPDYRTSNAEDWGHGMNTIGIIAAQRSSGSYVLQGICGNVKIMPVKVARSEEDSEIFMGWRFLEGLQYVEQQIKKGIPVKVINISGGGGDDRGPEIDAEITRLFAFFRDSGVLVVVAAPNTPTDVDSDKDYFSYWARPANGLDNVIAVTVTDKDDKFVPGHGYGAESVALAGPGTEISVLDPGYIFTWEDILSDPHTFILIREHFLLNFKKYYGNYEVGYLTLNRASSVKLDFLHPLKTDPDNVREIQKSADGNRITITLITGDEISLVKHEGNLGDLVSIHYKDATLFAKIKKHGSKTDVFAPRNIIPYAIVGGTSEVAPMVSATAALIFSKFPGMSYKDVKDRLTKGGDEIEDLFRWTSSSARLNAAGALEFAEIAGRAYIDNGAEGFQEGSDVPLPDHEIRLSAYGELSANKWNFGPFNEDSKFKEEGEDGVGLFKIFTRTDDEGRYKFKFVLPGTVVFPQEIIDEDEDSWTTYHGNSFTIAPGEGVYAHDIVYRVEEKPVGQAGFLFYLDSDQSGSYDPMVDQIYSGSSEFDVDIRYTDREYESIGPDDDGYYQIRCTEVSKTETIFVNAPYDNPPFASYGCDDKVRPVYVESIREFKKDLIVSVINPAVSYTILPGEEYDIEVGLKWNEANLPSISSHVYKGDVSFKRDFGKEFKIHSGLEGITVCVLAEGSLGTPLDDRMLEATTIEDGSYHIEGVIPGSAFVHVCDNPAGLVQLYPLIKESYLLDVPVSPRLNLNEIDFGFEGVHAAVFGLIFRDLDADGKFNNKDFPIHSRHLPVGVEVRSLVDNEIIASFSVVSDLDGRYAASIPPGNALILYYPCDSDMKETVPGNHEYRINVEEGRTYSGRDFGYSGRDDCAIEGPVYVDPPLEVVIPLMINITKFEDLNENGRKDDKEKVMPGFSFRIKDAHGNKLATVTSDKDGNAKFIIKDPVNNPPPYEVKELYRQGYIATTDRALYLYPIYNPSLVVPGAPTSLAINAMFGNIVRPADQPEPKEKSFTITQFVTAKLTEDSHPFKKDSYYQITVDIGGRYTLNDGKPEIIKDSLSGTIEFDRANPVASGDTDSRTYLYNTALQVSKVELSADLKSISYEAKLDDQYRLGAIGDFFTYLWFQNTPETGTVTGKLEFATPIDFMNFDDLTQTTTGSLVVKPLFGKVEFSSIQNVLGGIYYSDGFINNAPVANTVAYIQVEEGGTVTIDGSQSIDPDGDKLDYEWGVDSYQCPCIELDSKQMHEPKLTFVAPEVDGSNTYNVYLTVSDGFTSSGVVTKVEVKDKGTITEVKDVGGAGSGDYGKFTLTQEGTATLSKKSGEFKKGSYPVSIEITSDFRLDEKGLVSLADKSASGKTSIAGHNHDLDITELELSGDGKTLTYKADLVGMSGTVSGKVKFPASIDNQLDQDAGKDNTLSATMEKVKFDTKKTSAGKITFNSKAGDVSDNTQPVANAGPDQKVQGGSLVTLDGTASSDEDNDTLTYDWKQNADQTVELSNDEANKPTFTAPNVDQETTLTFELIVNDGTSDSEADTVDITVLPEGAGTAITTLTVSHTGTANIKKPDEDFEAGDHEVIVSISDVGYEITENNITFNMDSAKATITIGTKKFDLDLSKFTLGKDKKSIIYQGIANDNSKYKVSGTLKFAKTIDFESGQDTETQKGKSALQATFAKAKFDTKKTSTGMLDFQTIEPAQAALSADTDGDGLTDNDETNLYGTDPANIDTDGDAVSDGDEIAAGMDPLVPDQAVATGAVLVPTEVEQMQSQWALIAILLAGVAMAVAVSLLQGRRK